MGYFLNCLQFFFKIHLFFLMIFLFNKNVSAAPSQDSKIKFKLVADMWCPYTCEKGSRPGYLVELVQMSLKNQPVDVEYIITNWARAVPKAREGDYDALAGASMADAEGFMFPSISQLDLDFEIFTLKESDWVYQGNFKNKKVGVINGYTYDEDTNILLEKKDPSLVSVSGESGHESLIPMLMKKRIHGILETRGVFFENIKLKKIDINKFKSIGRTTKKSIPHYIAFSPKFQNSKKIMDLLVEGQKSLEKNGDLKKLRLKYGLEF